MNDAPWHLASWEGNRRAQQRAFMALSFREKIEQLERMEEVVERFEVRRRERGLPTRHTDPSRASPPE